MARRIALISDHASPLAALGGVDSGGQNVYVAQVARELAARGHEVDVFTRRDRNGQPRIVEWCRNVRVIHVPAGPAVPRKGIDNAIRGLGCLRRAHGIDATLLVVGGSSDVPDPQATPETGRLAAAAAHDAAGQRVIFTGRRSRELLKLYYAAADALVTTPRYEPFGITPLEAMACGTPVIGSYVGGLKYTIQDGETGFLVPPDDPEALGERFARFYGSPRLMRRMSRSALRRAHSLFTWERVVAKLDRVYARAARWDAPAAVNALRPVRALAPEAGLPGVLGGALLP